MADDGSVLARARGLYNKVTKVITIEEGKVVSSKETKPKASSSTLTHEDDDDDEQGEEEEGEEEEEDEDEDDDEGRRSCSRRSASRATRVRRLSSTRGDRAASGTAITKSSWSQMPPTTPS